VFAKREEFLLADEPLFLDLNGGGIRDIAYDKRLQGYLILSQREGTKKEKSFKLWFWSGDPTEKPRRNKIAGVGDIERAEGVAPVRLDNHAGVMLVSDDGDKSRNRGARYIVIDYSQFKKIPGQPDAARASHRDCAAKSASEESK
jgi:hypothetical protein